MIELNYQDARPLYSQIADKLQQQIALGALTQGDRLPSVRELASQLTINPNTIQRAYRELENRGWIQTAPGRGCFVADSRSMLLQRQREMLRVFDRVVSQLTELGVDAQTLYRHIAAGGNCHA